MSQPNMTSKLVAEGVGTFLLVFAGCGAVVTDGVSGALTHVGVAVVWGLVVMSLIYAMGEVSGAHFNPAVTIGFWISRRLEGRCVLPYVLAQTAGAFAAAGVLRLMFGNVNALGTTLPAGTVVQSFALEAILTFFLMLVILQVSTGSKEVGTMAGIAIGGVVGLEAMFAGPISGASMNPARSLGPAVVSGNMQHLWAYLAAPVLGATIAVAVWRLVRQPRAQSAGC